VTLNAQVSYAAFTFAQVSELSCVNSRGSLCCGSDLRKRPGWAHRGHKPRPGRAFAQVRHVPRYSTARSGRPAARPADSSAEIRSSASGIGRPYTSATVMAVSPIQ
jgi:hypothetical protein